MLHKSQGRCTIKNGEPRQEEKALRSLYYSDHYLPGRIRRKGKPGPVERNPVLRGRWYARVGNYCYSLFASLPAGRNIAVALGSTYSFTNSTRRFLARPSSVELSAMGLFWPRPLAERRLRSMPISTRRATTASARASESV